MLINKDLQQKLKKFIDTVHPISNKTFNKFLELISLETINQGSFIKKGRRTSKEYFILSGLIRTYVESPNGKEITLNFYPESSLLSPYKTRTQEGISTIYIDALSPTQVASIDAQLFFQLSVENPEIRILATRFIENDLTEKSKKEIMLASMPGKEKLLFFRERFPTLENYIPHTYIASYCGITNVSLSRFRSMKNLS